ncbi:MAG: ABC transporter permease [Verrucomicrobiae bacterium]|nr:ABC transporter permease [Verrucomicrobiae bacterium]
MINDLRLAFRQLGRNPGFAGVAAFTLAVGIGANTVVLSWIRATLVDAIPGAEAAHRLVVLAPQHLTQGVNDTMSLADIGSLREATNVFAGITGSQIDAMPVRIGREIEWVWGQAVQANFFEVLGVRPVLGRAFVEGEDEAGAAERVAVIGHRLWRNRFGGSADVVGRTIEIQDRRVTIVGVAPAGFRGTMGGLDLQLWFPLSGYVAPEVLRQRTESRGWRWLHTVGRLQEGVGIREARAAAGAIGQRLAEAHPNSNRDSTLAVLPLWRSPWGGQEVFLPLLRALAVVAVLLLALVTANVANLLLARAQGRESEIAVRAALGAGPGRLLRQFLTESLVLAVLGGAGGVALAWLGKGLLLSLMPATYLPIAYDLRIDGWALLATAGLTLGAGLCFGLVPALRALRLDLHDTLKAGGRAQVGPASRAWLRRSLVVGEVGLACVVLLGMGLCVRSFQKARQIEVGLDPSQVWVTGFRVSPHAGDAAWVNGLFRRLREEAARLPGVESAGLVDWLPLGFEDGSTTGFEIPGYVRRPGESISARSGVVSPGYFGTLRIPIEAGRDFRDDDAGGEMRAVVVNRAFANRYFPGRDPVGLTFRLWGGDARIIGVVATGKYRTLDEPPQPYLYVLSETMGHRTLTLAVRARGSLRAVGREVDRLAVSIDPQLSPVAGLSYEQYMAAALAVPRMAAVLLTALGAIALGLAGLGTYAVMAQGAQQRRREIGVRMALGARPGDIRRLIVGQGLTMAALGLGLGGVAGVAAARALGGVLVGVTAADPLAWAVPPILLLAATVAACWWPAVRAARVDPMEALRGE